MKYCTQCAAELARAIPANDNRQRLVCSACACVHYVNPKIIVGTIPIWNNQILLCRRNIEPRLGFWTIPAGFLEMGETLAAGAYRETLEESLAKVEIQYLQGLYDLTHIGQLYAIFVAAMIDDHFGITPESSEVRLFAVEDIPWDEMAFTVIATALRRYLENADQAYPIEPT